MQKPAKHMYRWFNLNIIASTRQEARAMLAKLCEPLSLVQYAEDCGWLERGQADNEVAVEEVLGRIAADEPVAIEDGALNGYQPCGEVITTHFCSAGGWAEQLQLGTILTQQE